MEDVSTEIQLHLLTYDGNLWNKYTFLVNSNNNKNVFNKDTTYIVRKYNKVSKIIIKIIINEYILYTYIIYFSINNFYYIFIFFLHYLWYRNMLMLCVFSPHNTNICC